MIKHSYDHEALLIDAMPLGNNRAYLPPTQSSPLSIAASFVVPLAANTSPLSTPFPTPYYFGPRATEHIILHFSERKMD